MEQYEFNIRTSSLANMFKNVIAEDFVHWWIIFEFWKLIVGIETYWTQSIFQSILFALGHLGNPFRFQQVKRMAADPKFWKFKFPSMLIFGYFYFSITWTYGKIAMTLSHLLWNIFVLSVLDLLDKRSPAEKQAAYWQELGKYHEFNPVSHHVLYVQKEKINASPLVEIMKLYMNRDNI